MSKKVTNFSWRLAIFGAAVYLFLMLLVMRLVVVQLIDPENLKLKAYKQYIFERLLLAERGSIFDRNYKLFAMNVPTISVIAHPGEIRNPSYVAGKLAKVLGKNSRYYLSLLKKKSEFVYIARRQPADVKNKIEKLGIEGIECRTLMARKYPKGYAACQVLGFTNVDNKGLSGIESTFNSILRGIPGKAVLQKTATYEKFVRAEYPLIPPENGKDVVLTLDYRYQAIAEKELHKTIAEFNADSGAVVIMNPKTGEVLSMASEPSFDPNRAGEFPAASWRLRAITDQYEPGSTFKLVLMSAILNEKLHRPDDIVFCENGKFDVMGETIHDSKPHGWLTLRDVIVKSSNIGMAKLSMEVDKNLFYEYARAYGFGTKSGIQLDGETEGTLKQTKEWSGFTPLAMAYGHEIAASPLQMCNLYSTIANGGFLLQPNIVKEIRKDGKVVSKPGTQIIRRVIRESTADTLANFLRKVVVEGTGKNAEIPGAQVCGKTGTAKVARRKSRGYGNEYIASFAGFFPKDDPKICMFVMINNPKVNYYGGSVAAPCFRRIAEQIISIEGYQFDDVNGKMNWAARDSLVRSMPDFLGLSRRDALRLAQNQGLTIGSIGNGDVVVSQKPMRGSSVNRNEKVQLVTATSSGKTAKEVRVPNVLGLPMRNAINVLSASGVKAVPDGSGKVRKQKPLPGGILKPGEQVLLQGETSVDLRKLVSL